MSIWVIVPAFNEMHRVVGVLDDLSALSASVVVVDDGSYDQTAELAASRNVHVLRHMVNRGQGAALLTGIDFALSRGATFLVTFDSDGQHRAADVPQMIEILKRSEADLVLGSRFLGSAPGIPLHRRVLLKLAVLFTRLTTGMRLTDAHNGLRAMTADAARTLRFSEDGMAHASQILSLAARSRLRVVEVPCQIRYTTESLEKGQKSSAAFKVLGRLAIARLLK
jgi:glycosyltransferase involved in cell wall biosynthesis